MDASIRPAAFEDLPTIHHVLVRSITEICKTSYDDKTIQLWLSQRSPKIIEGWLDDEMNYFVVAEIDDQIVGVGLLWLNRQVKLCYVNPDFIGKGVGKVLMLAMEIHAVMAGAKSVEISSTLNAVGFYQKFGYQSLGEEVAAGAIRFMKMSKSV